MSFSMAAATILATDPTPICTTTEPGLIGTITDWLIMLMETIGGIGVALAIALESIFPPIPSEVILPLAGFTAARGTLSLPGAIIWATPYLVPGPCTASPAGWACIASISRQTKSPASAAKK